MDILRAKEIMENDTRLVEDERFKIAIIPNISSVHIPVEIYDGGEFSGQEHLYFGIN